MAEPMIRVEVVYAAVDRQELLALDMPVGTSVRAAAIASGMAERFPELDLVRCQLGIFGKLVGDPEQRKLEAGDRVEIYRPLLADPKEVRRLRALKAADARKAQKPI
ncbi:RnfH family protein [Pseudomonas sp. KU26590]|uniref:RnfH family protein n=1 Tax=Pseudomonas sp. KU26590 TaxID=2991051 RepID=UPI00223DB0BE|nr:RnfH family protein [Pseudomonas sp. KU26590]UZJ59856.1 RnfH family protein [Pseudomonas sp. KU26590]